MAAGPFVAAAFSVPALKYGVQAGAAYINSHGGLGPNHDKVDVIACNTQASPTAEATCMRQAVSEHVVAVVGADFYNPTQGFATLAAANIPLLADIPGTPDQYAAKNSFPIFFNHSLYIAAAEAAVKDGCKKVDYVTINLAISLANEGIVHDGIKAAGGTPGDTITLPLTATDFAPVVARLNAGHSDCIVASLTNPAVAALISAISASGSHISVYGSVGVFTTQATAATPKAFEGSYMISPFSALNQSLPGYSTYVASVQSSGQSATTALDENVFNGWLGMMMLQKATANQPTITGNSVLQYMRGASSVDVGYGQPPINFTTPVNQSSLAGIFETSVFVQKATSGKYTTTSTIDTRQVLTSN
jgi:ABC-type branched-subunit amino acid transport system substrate-binding protein